MFQCKVPALFQRQLAGLGPCGDPKGAKRSKKQDFLSHEFKKCAPSNGELALMFPPQEMQNYEVAGDGQNALTTWSTARFEQISKTPQGEFKGGDGARRTIQRKHGADAGDSKCADVQTRLC